MRDRTRLLIAGLFVCLTLARPLEAQRAPGGSLPRCAAGAAPTVGLTALVGAWVGLVLEKIAVSDWDSVARTTRGPRALRQSLITGAVAGALFGAAVRTPGCLRERRLAQLRLSRADIDRARIRGSAYDAVVALRPDWLRGSGASVFLNRSRLRSPEQLRAIPVSSVTTIVKIEDADARAQLGAERAAEVIQVQTTAASPP